MEPLRFTHPQTHAAVFRQICVPADKSDEPGSSHTAHLEKEAADRSNGRVVGQGENVSVKSGDDDVIRNGYTAVLQSIAQRNGHYVAGTDYRIGLFPPAADHLLAQFSGTQFPEIAVDYIVFAAVLRQGISASGIRVR